MKFSGNRFLFVFLVLLGMGCSSTSSRRHDTRDEMKKSSQSTADNRHSPGPLLSEPDQLRLWIENHLKAESKSRVVIPVFISGLEEAVLQAPTVMLGDDRDRSPMLKIDDMALGIPFPQQAQSALKGANEGWIWLEGSWGELVSLGLPVALDDNTYSFAVRKVSPLAEDETPIRVWD